MSTDGQRWLALAVLMAFGSLLSGCVLNPTAAPAQHSGPLEIRLTKVGQPAGGWTPPPRGYDLLECGVDVLNTTTSTIDLRYKDGELLLYSDGSAIGGQYEGTSSTGGTVAHELLDSSSTVLPGRGSVAVFRRFLIKSGQRNLTLVYRLPGHGQFKWRVR